MRKTIRTEKLRAGMFVVDFHTPWTNHPFLTNQKRIRKADEIRHIRDCGITLVTIDTARGADVVAAQAADPTAEAAAVPSAPQTQPPSDSSSPPLIAPREVPFDEELGRAREIYGEAKVVVQDLFESARLGQSIDGEAARCVVRGMIESIFRNPDALISLAHLRTFDDYTFRHSVNVGVLSLQLGRAQGIVRRELLHLGLGAVLHDLGKVRIPGDILHKPGRLTPAEFEIMKAHPAYGAQTILASPSLPDEAAAAALNHHERQDGTGYPRGLTGMHPGKFGLITAIADVYDAMTTDRVYRAGSSPHEVLKEIYSGRGTHFHPLYVQRFIQCLGIYPAGTAVRLDTGELGVVIRQNRGHPLRPWVRLIRKADGTPQRAPEEVDLCSPLPGDEACFARTIDRVLTPGTVKVDMERLLFSEMGWRRDPNLKVVLGNR